MELRPHVLVTGGAGYIGSHAAYALQKAGFVPVVIDSLVNGNRGAIKFGPFEQGDVGDADFIQTVCQRYQPIALMHFAAFIEVGESVKEPQKYLTNNALKAKRLFDTIHGCGVRHAIFSSTAAVYGAVKTSEPITEEAPLRPINPYGQSKLEAEGHLVALGDEGLRSVILRYFNAAGAAPLGVWIGETHFPEPHLIPRLLLPHVGIDSKVLKAFGLDRGITLNGTNYRTKDGTAIRDYIHVLDLVTAHIRALEYLLSGGASDIFNLGHGSGFSIREVIQTTEAVLGVSVPVNEGDRRPGDPAVLIADSSKARQLLDWWPQYALEQIIASALEWHQSQAYRDAIHSRLSVAAQLA